jgi:hypothetical protein
LGVSSLLCVMSKNRRLAPLSLPVSHSPPPNHPCHLQARLP